MVYIPKEVLYFKQAPTVDVAVLLTTFWIVRVYNIAPQTACWNHLRSWKTKNETLMSGSPTLRNDLIDIGSDPGIMIFNFLRWHYWAAKFERLGSTMWETNIIKVTGLICLKEILLDPLYLFGNWIRHGTGYAIGLLKVFWVELHSILRYLWNLLLPIDSKPLSPNLSWVNSSCQAWQNPMMCTQVLFLAY